MGTFRLGVFIVAALAILFGGIFLIGQRQFLFSSTYALKAEFTNVSGLNNGAAVRVGGIPKGTVRQIQLPSRPDGKMTVVMDLETNTRNVIKKDSVASIQTEGLLGSKFVDISFGTDSSPSVKDGETIASMPPVDISDLIQKANNILNSTETTMSNAALTTEHFKSMSEKIDEGRGTVGALINDKSAFEELNAAVAQARAGATDFQENMEALKHNFFLRGFFNRRGYEDASQLTKYEIDHLPEGNYIKEFDYRTTQLFNKKDSSKLENPKALDAAGQFLQGNKFGLAVTVVSDGMTGDTDKDLVLTRAQAMVVREYLVNHFKMDDTRFKTLGLGKIEQPGGSEVGTVAILVYPVGVNPPPAKTLASNGH